GPRGGKADDPKNLQGLNLRASICLGGRHRLGAGAEKQSTHRQGEVVTPRLGKWTAICWPNAGCGILEGLVSAEGSKDIRNGHLRRWGRRTTHSDYAQSNFSEFR